MYLKTKIKHTSRTKNTTHNCTGCNLRKAVVNFVSRLSWISKFLLFWCCAGKNLETFLLLWRLISTFLCRDGWIAFCYLISWADSLGRLQSQKVNQLSWIFLLHDRLSTHSICAVGRWGWLRQSPDRWDAVNSSCGLIWI